MSSARSGQVESPCRKERAQRSCPGSTIAPNGWKSTHDKQDDVSPFTRDRGTSAIAHAADGLQSLPNGVGRLIQTLPAVGLKSLQGRCGIAIHLLGGKHGIPQDSSRPCGRRGSRGVGCFGTILSRAADHHGGAVRGRWTDRYGGAADR